jgi:uncharacterized protein
MPPANSDAETHEECCVGGARNQATVDDPSTGNGELCAMHDVSERLAEYAANLRCRLGQERSLVLDIRAIPRSRSASVAEVMANGVLKVKVTAAPEKGRANEEICAVLAEYLSVPKRNVSLVNGFTSAQKRVRITL